MTDDCQRCSSRRGAALLFGLPQHLGDLGQNAEEKRQVKLFRNQKLEHLLPKSTTDLKLRPQIKLYLTCLFL